MRVLIVNPYLDARTGSELYVRDLALGLAVRGDEPIVYSPKLGAPATELSQTGVEVVAELDDVSGTPDIIYAHGHVTAVSALLRFPATPGVFVCHSSDAWIDTAPLLPRIRRYVAVDLYCRERLRAQDEIPDDRIDVIPNAVDLARFAPREAPLPPRPARALLFSNYTNEGTQLQAVRSACRRARVELEVIDSRNGKSCATPEDELPKYDLVFAKGRSALEALAVGAAVVVCGREGVGPMVCTENIGHLRDWNFGRRVADRPLTADTLLGEIRRYDSDDAAKVSANVRETAGLESMVDSLAELFERVLLESAEAPLDEGEDMRAIARYAEWLTPFVMSYPRLCDLEKSPLFRARRAMGEHPRVDRLIGHVGRRIGRMLSG